RSGSAFTLNVGDAGGANVFWSAFGDGGSGALTVNVHGIVNMFSARLDLAVKIVDDGEGNVIDANGTSDLSNGSVNWRTGTKIEDGGTLNITADTANSNLLITRDNFSANYQSPTNEGTINLHANAGKTAQLVVSGEHFNNDSDFNLAAGG